MMLGPEQSTVKCLNAKRFSKLEFGLVVENKECTQYGSVYFGDLFIK
jgi:hypothetical protein